MAIGSIPAKGSSSKINLGLLAKALAISVLLLSPPESRSPLFLRMCSRPNSLNNDYIFSFCNQLLNQIKVSMRGGA